MKKTSPAAPKPTVHLLMYAFGALFTALAAAFEPMAALGATIVVVAYLSKV